MQNLSDEASESFLNSMNLATTQPALKYEKAVSEKASSENEEVSDLPNGRFSPHNEKGIKDIYSIHGEQASDSTPPVEHLTPLLLHHITHI